MAAVDAVNESELTLCCALCCANFSFYRSCDCYGCSGKVRCTTGLLQKNPQRDKHVLQLAHHCSCLWVFVSHCTLDYDRPVSVAATWNAASSQERRAFSPLVFLVSNVKTTEAVASMRRYRLAVALRRLRFPVTKRCLLQCRFSD